MKKIKGLLFAFVALFAFTIAMVTVSAAGEKYGVYTVSEAGKKAEWDFTQNAPGGSYSITTISDETVYGIGGATSKVQFKSAGNLSNGGSDGANIYVPVPSADAAGSISFVGNDNARYVELTVSGGTKIYAKKDGQNETAFTSTDVSESNGHYYLTLVGSSAGKELKASKITVVLTNGAYAATAAKITVTLKDANDKVLRTDNTVESGSAYEKGYAVWGYDTTGYFLDSALTQAYENSELTEDTTLYVGLNAWDGVIANPNHLTNALVAKLNGVELGDTYPLTGTIYSVLKSASYGVKTGDDGYSYISTGGATSEKAEKAVQIVAEKAGTLKVTITSGGTSARNASVINVSTKKAVSVLEGNASWDATAAAAYEVRTLTYDLEAGTYNVGGDNGMRILSMEFTPEVPSSPINLYQEAAFVGEMEIVRYIGIVEGFSVAQVTGNFTLVLNSEALPGGSFDITEYCQVVTSLTSNGEVYTTTIDGEEYTFDEKADVVYVICVVAVANDGNGLTNQYLDAEITATLSIEVLQFEQTTEAYKVRVVEQE